MQQFTEKPPKDVIVLQTHDIKTLWHLQCGPGYQ